MKKFKNYCAFLFAILFVSSWVLKLSAEDLYDINNILDNRSTMDNPEFSNSSTENSDDISIYVPDKQNTIDSSEFLKVSAKDSNNVVIYVPDNQITIDSTLLSSRIVTSVIEKLEFIDCKDQPLYKDGGPKFEDVNQKNLGVGHFLAPVASIVAADPQKIMDCLEDQNDGTVIVNLHDPLSGTFYKIKVDKSIPNLSSYYSFISEDSPLWVHMLLKGFVAATCRNYKYAEVGRSIDVIKMLTGKEVEFFNVFDMFLMGENGVHKEILKALTNKKVVTCVFSSQFSPSFVCKNLVQGQVYSVVGLDYDPKSKKDYVIINNPWGKNEKGAWGIWKISLSDFFQSCTLINISTSEDLKKARFPMLFAIKNYIHTNSPTIVGTLALSAMFVIFIFLQLILAII